MNLNDAYYDELKSILNGFSKGQFNFDEKKLKSLSSEIHQDITDSLIAIKKRQEQSETIHAEIKNVKESITKNGTINSRLNTLELEDKWLETANNINAILDYSSKHLDEIISVINHVAMGNLNAKMRLTIDGFEIKGDFLYLATTINTMVDQLSQFASELTRVAKEVGTDGLLGVQAKVEGVSGTWLDLTNNVNAMADSLTVQVRNIANVTTAVAQGDLSQRITVDAKGEVLELKQTINTMVDQLSQFSSEVNRVTKEVGIDGILGGQAKVEDVSGVWLDLTNNINAMSNSLEQIDIENKSQNWIKDGVSALSKEMLQKDNLSEQTDIAINQVSRYINAGMGVLYLYHNNDKTLRLEASYAYTKNKTLPYEFRLGEGIIGQVAHDKKPIHLSSRADSLLIQTGTTEYSLLNTYTSPLVFKDKLVGVAELASYHPFTELQIEYIESALSVLAGSFYISLQVRDKERLQHILITDSLTGTYNRGYFDEVMPQVLNAKKRNDSLMSFAILDIDFFKNFNDSYGHHMGDEVLRRVANVLREHALRNNDLCFRVGGEEFAMIFSAHDQYNAYDFMFKIKDEIEQLIIKNNKDEVLDKVTISIGLTCKRASEIRNIQELYTQTDKLLYKAKENGRNRIEKNETV